MKKEKPSFQCQIVLPEEAKKIIDLVIPKTSETLDPRENREEMSDQARKLHAMNKGGTFQIDSTKSKLRPKSLENRDKAQGEMVRQNTLSMAPVLMPTKSVPVAAGQMFTNIEKNKRQFHNKKIKDVIRGVTPDFLQKRGDGVVHNMLSELTAGLVDSYSEFKQIFEKDDEDEFNQIQMLTKKTSVVSPQTPAEFKLEKFTKAILAAMTKVSQKSRSLREIEEMAAAAKDTAVGIKFGASSHAHDTPLDVMPVTRHHGQISRLNSQMSLISETTDPYKKAEQLELQLQRSKVAYEKKIEELQKQMKDMRMFEYEFRRDCQKEIQTLRIALLLSGEVIKPKEKEQFKIGLNIHFFNELKGCDPELIEIFNSRLEQCQDEAQVEVDKATNYVDELQSQIEKYKLLSPDQYALVDMSLNKIFEAIQIIQPAAFPVWEAMIQTFPQDHFMPIIKTVAQSYADNSQKTYDKMIDLVDTNVAIGIAQFEEQIKEQEIRIKDLERYNVELMHTLEEERAVQQKQLEFEREAGAFNAKALLEEQAVIVADKTEEEITLMNQSMDRKRIKIQKLRGITVDYNIRMALFKWRQTAVFMRLIDELVHFYVDKDGFRTIMQQDLQKLFLSNSISSMQNSLEHSKFRILQLKQQVTDFQEENFALKIKTNELLNEINTQKEHIERCDQKLDDAQTHIYKQLKAKQSAQSDVIKFKLQLADVTKLLQKQIDLKEKIEDKVNSTLTMSKMNKKQNQKDKNYHKQRDTKLLLDGLDIELTSHGAREALILNKEQQERFNVEAGEMVSKYIQTDVKAVNKDIEMVTTQRKLPKPEKIKPDTADCEIQSDLSYNVIEFMSLGSQRYERVIKYGLIRPEKLEQVNIDIMECDDYYQKLIQAEQKDAMLFYHRKKFVIKGITDYVGEIDENIITDVYKPTLAERLATALRKGPLTRALAQQSKGKGQEQSEAYIVKKKREDAEFFAKIQGSMSGDEGLNYGQDTLDSKSPGTNRQVIRVDSGELSQTPHEMDPVLGADKLYNLDLPSGDEELKKTLNQVVSGKLFGSRETIDTFEDKQKKKQAREVFNMYVDLVEVIKGIDAELVRQAIRVLKKEQHKNFDVKGVHHMKKLYPDEVPDVYTRLWGTKQTTEQETMLNFMVKQARDEWKRKLMDQGLADDIENIVSSVGSDVEPYLGPVSTSPHLRNHKRPSPEKAPPQALTKFKCPESLVSTLQHSPNNRTAEKNHVDITRDNIIVRRSISPLDKVEIKVKDDISTQLSERTRTPKEKKNRSTSGSRSKKRNSTITAPFNTLFSPTNLLDMPGSRLHKKTVQTPNVFTLPFKSFDMRGSLGNTQRVNTRNITRTTTAERDTKSYAIHHVRQDPLELGIESLRTRTFYSNARQQFIRNRPSRKSIEQTKKSESQIDAMQSIVPSTNIESVRVSHQFHDMTQPSSKSFYKDIRSNNSRRPMTAKTRQMMTVSSGGGIINQPDSSDQNSTVFETIQRPQSGIQRNDIMIPSASNKVTTAHNSLQAVVQTIQGTGPVNPRKNILSIPSEQNEIEYLDSGSEVSLAALTQKMHPLVKKKPARIMSAHPKRIRHPRNASMINQLNVQSMSSHHFDSQPSQPRRLHSKQPGDQNKANATDYKPTLKTTKGRNMSLKTQGLIKVLDQTTPNTQNASQIKMFDQ